MFRNYMYQMPRLQSGEAVDFYITNPNRETALISMNNLICGLILQLGKFGIPNMSFTTISIANWIYTVILIATAAWFARGNPTRK